MRGLVKLNRNKSKKLLMLDKPFYLPISREVYQSIMGHQLGSWVDSTGQQYEVANTHAGRIDNHSHQDHDFLKVDNLENRKLKTTCTQTKTLTCSPSSAASGLLFTAWGKGLLETKSTLCRSSHHLRHSLAADEVLHVVRDQEILNKGHCPDVTAAVDLPFDNSQILSQPSTADGEMLGQQDDSSMEKGVLPHGLSGLLKI